jgi:hypothetical protein
MAVVECSSIILRKDRQHSSYNKTIAVTHFARHKDN